MSDSIGETPHDAPDEANVLYKEFDTGENHTETDVAEVLAEIEDAEATDLSAMYDCIDHLVNHLFDTPPAPEAQARLEFTYEGYRIRLTQDGHAEFLKVSGKDNP